jgi:hypothetical protein
MWKYVVAGVTGLIGGVITYVCWPRKGDLREVALYWVEHLKTNLILNKDINPNKLVFAFKNEEGKMDAFYQDGVLSVYMNDELIINEQIIGAPSCQL